MNRIKFRRAAALIAGVIMAMAASTCVYAFEGTYHDFRESEISIYLPEGWASEELDAENSEDLVCEEILHAYDDTGDSALNLGVYFMTDEPLPDDYIYFDGDEAGAMEYYENYGEEAVDAAYDTVSGWSSEDLLQSWWETSEPVFFDGEWNGFLVMDVSGAAEFESSNTEEFNHTVYLTAGMTDDSKVVVHNLLVFYRDDNSALTEEDAELAQDIADGFFDYGYGDVMAGTAEDDSLWGSGDDYGTDNGLDAALDIIIGVVGTVIPLLITAAVIVIVLRKVLRRRKKAAYGSNAPIFKKISKEIKDVKQDFDLEEAASKWKRRRAEKDGFSGRERRAEKRAEKRTERRSTMQMRTREAESAEQRYFESLKTLHKTGLLTKDEMRDMLERHERNRARQRRR